MSQEKTAWLIEKIGANGNTSHYLWVIDDQFRWMEVVQDVYHRALGFAREEDAWLFLKAVRQLQQSLPYRDVVQGLASSDDPIRVVEHIWVR